MRSVSRTGFARHGHTFAALLLLSGCVLSKHPIADRADLGVARSLTEISAVAGSPGTVTVETVVSADWVASRAGLINIKHPEAVKAGLPDGDEPVQLSFHAIRHPTRGLYVVDTGVEESYRTRASDAAIRGFVAWFIGMSKIQVRTSASEWIARQKDPVRGIFITHMHPDHLTGMADFAAETPVYTGPGEARASAFINFLIRPNIDRALARKGAIREWHFSNPARSPEGSESPLLDGIVDVFGDGLVWALWVPGHTAGSTAYLARTPGGPVLMTCDASHTRWGWDHGVEPGTFSNDIPRSAKSLAALKKLVADHPSIQVRVGHQP